MENIWCEGIDDEWAGVDQWGDNSRVLHVDLAKWADVFLSRLVV